MNYRLLVQKRNFIMAKPFRRCACIAWLLLMTLMPITTAQNEEQSMSTMKVCSDTAIQLEDVSIVCDSPGTYYYGSSKYRNSASCQQGDKAKIVIDFYIADPDKIK